mmetsp:Transcript_24481/g.48843  ORF Transcript_24481/g.48843 Transcript_24481/m.48843 type:complete len:227 (-) Transcript_24481:744-1424(-)
MLSPTPPVVPATLPVASSFCAAPAASSNLDAKLFSSPPPAPEVEPFSDDVVDAVVLVAGALVLTAAAAAAVVWRCRLLLVVIAKCKGTTREPTCTCSDDDPLPLTPTVPAAVAVSTFAPEAAAEATGKELTAALPAVLPAAPLFALAACMRALGGATTGGKAAPRMSSHDRPAPSWCVAGVGVVSAQERDSSRAFVRKRKRWRLSHSSRAGVKRGPPMDGEVEAEA